MTIMKRAWSSIEVKAAQTSNGKRTFSGIASTPTPDLSGDVMNPLGAVYDLPLPFLWQHDSKQPIGWITAVRPTKKNIEVDGEVATIDTPGTLKDRLDEAWDCFRTKLVRGLSIGFVGIDMEQIKGTFGLFYKSWQWVELSGVTVPMNLEANIQTVKSLDAKTIENAKRLRILPLGHVAPIPSSLPVVKL